MARKKKTKYFQIGFGQPLPEQGWRVDNANDVFVEQCSYSQKQYKIIIAFEVWAAVLWLIRNIQLEWQMFLKGTVEDNICRVSGYYIPQQKVAAATVENIEDMLPSKISSEGIVATIHSHANMGVSFSSVDRDETIIGDINYHICVNNSLDIIAIAKELLPCGKYRMQKATVEIEGIKPEGAEKIEKKTIAYSYPTIMPEWYQNIGGEYGA